MWFIEWVLHNPIAESRLDCAKNQQASHTEVFHFFSIFESNDVGQQLEVLRVLFL